MNNTIIGIKNVPELKSIIENNKGLVIIKLGARWCQPCRSIEDIVTSWFKKMNSINLVQTFLVDIDEDYQIFAYLKNKKMLQGIPAILMYQKSNSTLVFDDCVNSSNVEEIDQFFSRCIETTKMM